MASVGVRVLNSLSVLGFLSIAPLLFLTRRYFAGTLCKCQTDLRGKTIIITGGNSGIGKSTASVLAGLGADVLLACRDLNKARESQEDVAILSRNPYIFCEVLDLTSFRSIFQFVVRLENRGIKNIYALINNAGVFYHPFQVTEDGFEVTFQTNYLGPFLLTYLLLKENLLSEGSRIINVSSEAHRIPKHLSLPEIASKPSIDRFMRYGESKLCLNLFTLKLSSVLKNISVLSVNPGNVETNVYRHFPYLNNCILYALQKPFRLLLVKTPWEGAQTVVHAAVNKECIKNSGSYLSDCKFTKPSELSVDKKLADALWLLSLWWCGQLPDLAVCSSDPSTDRGSRETRPSPRTH